MHDQNGRRIGEIKHKETRIIHLAWVSHWDHRAISLCEKNFPNKSFTERIIYGDVNCADCKEAKRKAKRL